MPVLYPVCNRVKGVWTYYNPVYGASENDLANAQFRVICRIVLTL